MKHITKTNTVALDRVPGIILETADAGAKSERFFFRIVSVAIALAFGFAFASIEALDKNASGFGFQLSSGTLLAFAIGTAVGSIYGKILWLGESVRATALLRVAMFLLLLGGAAGFLYPLRFLSRERLVEVLHGLVTVTVALSLVGYMLWRIKNFLEQDDAKTEREAKERAAMPRAAQTPA